MENISIVVQSGIQEVSFTKIVDLSSMRIYLGARSFFSLALKPRSPKKQQKQNRNAAVFNQPGLGRQLKRSQHELQVGAPPCKVFEYVYV